MAIYKLKDICLKIGSGATPKGGKEAYCDEGISLIRSQNVLDFTFSYDGLAHINDQQAEKLSNVEVKPQDILLNITGDSVARVCTVDPRALPARVNQHVAIIRPDENRVLSSYILYFLQMIKPYLLQIAAGGATRNALTKSMIENLELEVPDILSQKKIVSVLDDIQGKIRDNNEINKNLEQQAQELFKAWFVTFETFGGKMPSSWSVAKLGDIATIKTNSFSPAKTPTVMLEHYSIPAFDEQKYPVFELAANVKSNKYILTDNSVMISKLNPGIKRVWRPMCVSEFAVSSTEFIIFEANDPTYKDYVFSVIDSSTFSDWMCAHTTGSTNSRQRTTPSTTLEFQIALPTQEVVSDFCKIVTPMYDMIAQNTCENRKLAAFRDSLLPKLMSGELDVSNIDLSAAKFLFLTVNSCYTYQKSKQLSYNKIIA